MKKEAIVPVALITIFALGYWLGKSTPTPAYAKADHPKNTQMVELSVLKFRDLVIAILSLSAEKSSESAVMRFKRIKEALSVMETEGVHLLDYD